MRFEIKEPLVNNLRDCFAVNINVYSGDADGYDAFRVLGFKRNQDEDLLESILNVIQKVKAAYPNGRGGDDHLKDKVPGFSIWFDEYRFDDEEEEYYFPKDKSEERYLEILSSRVIEFKERSFDLYTKSFVDSKKGYWPGDVSLVNYSSSEASYSSHSVTYFDENGVEHKVEVI